MELELTRLSHAGVIKRQQSDLFQKSAFFQTTFDVKEKIVFEQTAGNVTSALPFLLFLQFECYKECNIWASTFPICKNSNPSSGSDCFYDFCCCKKHRLFDFSGQYSGLNLLFSF